MGVLLLYGLRGVVRVFQILLSLLVVLFCFDKVVIVPALFVVWIGFSVLQAWLSAHKPVVIIRNEGFPDRLKALFLSATDFTVNIVFQIFGYGLASLVLVAVIGKPWLGLPLLAILIGGMIFEEKLQKRFSRGEMEEDGV